MATVSLTPLVSIGGSALATNWQSALLEIRVERALNVPGRATVRFLDPGYALLQSKSVTLGATFKITDPSGAHVLLKGFVTGIGCEQREEEQPELVVVAHDLGYKLGLTSRVKTWTQVKVSTVVSTLASAAGLSPTSGSSASSATLAYLLQVDTNLGLLGELAQRVGADWWVATTTLYFGTPSELSSARTTVSLTLGSGLRSFSGRAVPAPASVTVTGWNITQQQTVTGQASSATTGVLPTSTLGGLATATGAFVTAAVAARSSTEAKTLSQALFDLRAGAAVEATGVADGNGTLSPGGTVTVASAGPLSGKYAITAVEHVYRPRRGFLTRIRSGDRRPAGIAEGARGRSAGGAGASIVGHHGVTAGIVTNIKDPTSSGRVKVQFPGMSSTQESAWARVVATGGGATRGNVFIPEVNDEVLVAFEDGDTRTPVVIGGLYGSKSKIPAPTLKDGKVQKRQLVSRLGHAFRFLDGTSTAQKAIELALADGQALHLGSDKTTLTLTSGKAFTITVGSTKITVAANTGALSLSAATISIKATSELKLAAPTISVSATTALTLKGLTVTVTGSSAVTVKASTEVGI
ncbi:MAG: VgrG-related protein, partial [Acidimicrobiales bacterium]